jgi:hypothetical protein
MKTYIIVASGFICLLLVSILFSPRRLVYDEINTVPTIDAFLSQPSLIVYFNSLTHASGPLYGILYSPVWVASDRNIRALRITTFGLMCCLITLLAFVLARNGSPAGYGFCLISIPPVWVCSGIALDESLSMVFLLLALAILGPDVYDVTLPVATRTVRFLAAGILIGFAALVRQPLILPAVAVLLSALFHRRRPIVAAWTPIVAFAMLIPLIIVWKGLTPPLVGRHFGFAIDHLIMGLAYGALFGLLIEPRFLWTTKLQIALLAFASVCTNEVFQIFTWSPLKSVAERLLSGSVLHAYSRVCGSLLIAAAVLCAISIARRTYESRKDPWYLAIHSSLCLMLLWPLVMQAQFSSRYTLTAVPFQILASQRFLSKQKIPLTRLCVGAALGALSLLTYYRPL